MEDQALKDKGGVPVNPEYSGGRIDFIGDGLALVKLQETDLEYIGNYFQAIYRQNSSSRNALSMLRGAMFSLGSKSYGNPEWREQCAGSLREILDGCAGQGNIANWFCATFKAKNQDFPSNSSNPEYYKRMQDFYAYFSEVHHHDCINILQKIQDLYGADKKAGDDTEELFINAAGDFIGYLVKFFNTNVKNL
jgi:hypothetical protein